MSRKMVTVLLSAVVGRLVRGTSTSRIGLADRGNLVHPIMANSNLTDRQKAVLRRKYGARDFKNGHQFRVPEEEMLNLFREFKHTFDFMTPAEADERLRQQFGFFMGSRGLNEISFHYRRSLDHRDHEDTCTFAHVFTATMPEYPEAECFCSKTRLLSVADFETDKSTNGRRISPLLHRIYETRIQ